MQYSAVSHASLAPLCQGAEFERCKAEALIAEALPQQPAGWLPPAAHACVYVYVNQEGWTWKWQTTQAAWPRLSFGA